MPLPENLSLELIMEECEPNSVVDHLGSYILECHAEMERLEESNKMLSHNLGIMLESNKRCKTVLNQLHAGKKIDQDCWTRLRSATLHEKLKKS